MSALVLNNSTVSFDIFSAFEDIKQFSLNSVDTLKTNIQLNILISVFRALSFTLDEDFKRMEKIYISNDIEAMNKINFDDVYEHYFNTDHFHNLLDVIKSIKNPTPKIQTLIKLTDKLLNKLARNQNYYGYIESTLLRVVFKILCQHRISPKILS